MSESLKHTPNRSHAKSDFSPRYGSLFHHLLDGILVFNIKLDQVVACNDAAVSLLGYENNSDVIGLHLSDIVPKIDQSYKGVDLRKRTISIIEKVTTGKVINTDGLILSKTGDRIYVNANIIANDDFEEEVFIVFKDVTDLFKTKLDLEESNLELRKYIDSNLQLDNFSYLASHDLKSPLRSIISFTQLLERRISNKLSPSELELFKYIKIAGLELDDIISQFLLFARLDAEDLNLAVVDIKVIVNQVLVELKTEVDEKMASVSIENDFNAIQVDQKKLTHAFKALISNALKFAKPNVKPHIKIYNEETPKKWIVHIEDNGIGIEEQYHDTIFALFKKLHHRKEITGAGIGLAVAQKAIAKHGGKIWLSSEPGKGSTFSFSICKHL